MNEVVSGTLVYSSTFNCSDEVGPIGDEVSANKLPLPETDCVENKVASANKQENSFCCRFYSAVAIDITLYVAL